MPAGSLGVAIEADADADAGALKRFKHRSAEQGPIGLDAHFHVGRHLAMQRHHKSCQPFRSGQQRFTAMQDDIDAFKSVPSCVLGDALDGLGGYSEAHSPRHFPPRLIRHFIHITV